VVVRALFLTAAVAATAPYCDAPPEVQEELARAAQVWDVPTSRADRNAGKRAILEPLVRNYPDDIQANRRYQNDLDHKKADLIAEYRKRLDAKPGDAREMYFYALALMSKDTPQAIQFFNDALKKDPHLAWAHLALSYVYAWGRFSDKAKTTEHVDKFFALCGTVLDPYPLRTLGSDGSSDVQKRVAKALRERLTTEPEHVSTREPLWDLEFKIAPPSAHPEIRKQIAADVERIRKTAPTLATLRVVRAGLRQAGDPPAVTAIEDEVLRLFPKSADAADITRSRWSKEHPYPKPADPEEKKREWALLKYPLAAKWIEQWPWDPSPRADRFGAARLLKDLPAAELKAAVDGLVGFLRTNEVMWSFPPFAHQAAEEYLQRGIFTEEAIALAEEGLRSVRSRETDREPSDLEPLDYAKDSANTIVSAEIATIDLLAQAYTKLKNADRAPALQARLDGFHPAEDGSKVAYMRARSRIAELAGRTADAFAYLEKTIAISPTPTNDYIKERQDAMKADLRRLWTALGGSDEAWNLRASEIREAKTASEWKAPEREIPAFSLADLTGKQWTTDSFAGKSVLVNVWASWCGPCRAEHPKLQKLYERIKDRKNIAVVSFNIDDQIGMVQPYLDEGKYTFPVLLAAAFVNGIFDGISIPRNWLIDSKGVHKLEQIGYAESSDWVERMTAELEKLAPPNK
jgi:thiol-disulfide isomerase/thioredoxin